MRRAALAVVLAAGLLYGVGLGARDLWAPDEPRYGAIAEELRSMRHGPGGLVLLHLVGDPYTQKPPLYFWLAALGGAPGGRVDELAARLPSAVAGVACVAMSIWIARRLLGHPTLALLAAGLLATSFRFAFTARRVQLDVLLTACELAAIAAFLWLERRPGGLAQARRRPLAIAGLHAALGAAALVKGPVGWLPLAVFAGYLAWMGRLRELRSIVPVWGWALSIGPVLAWIVAAVSLASPGFAEEAVYENLVGRFFAGTSHARPAYYYLYQLPLDMLPWSLLLPLGIPVLVRWCREHGAHSGDGRAAVPERSGEMRAGMPERSRETPERSGEARTVAPERFLATWAALPIVFFSLSAGKRGLYLLPIFPALAMIAALALLDRRSGRLRPVPVATRLAWTVAGVAALELALFAGALPWLHAEKSPRPIAEAAAAGTSPGEPVGVYALEPFEGAIPYYGARPVRSLPDEAALARFRADGGRIVVLRGRHLDALGERFGLVAVDRFRSGRRELAVARLREPEGPVPSSRAPDGSPERAVPGAGTDVDPR